MSRRTKIKDMIAWAIDHRSIKLIDKLHKDHTDIFRENIAWY
jgi:hypothetical protein